MIDQKGMKHDNPQPASQPASQPNVCAHCGSYIAGAVFCETAPDGEFSLYKNDFRDIKARIPAGSVDVVITDPPYGSGGFLARDTMRSSKTKYVSSGASYQSTLPDIDGDALHPEAWKELMLNACKEAKRVLKPGGYLLMFIDWRNLPILQEAIHAAGIQLRGTVVWDKGRAARPNKNGFRNQAEYILWGTHGAIVPRETPVFLHGVLRHTTITNGKVHITQKPESLMAELVEICLPGGVIYDPFMGSGTTGVAALKTGRKFIGAESVEHYFDTAVKRCLQALSSNLCN
jgi:site-specific DNA-methyltransferase (adenine-specific)